MSIPDQVSRILDKALNQNLISLDQAVALKALFEEDDSQPQSRFTGLHVLYFFGGLLVLASMSWFLTLAWTNGTAIALTSLVFACLYFFIGNHLWRQKDFEIPGGLLITAAVGLTPLTVYGFEKALGLIPQTLGNYRDFHVWIRESWVWMELATVAIGTLALRKYRFPFLTFPLAFVLWYFSMDLAPFLWGESVTWNERSWCSVASGLVILLIAYRVDFTPRKEDLAFWLYLAGLLAFWGGLTSMNSDNEWGKFIYALINLSLIAKGVFLRRRTFAVFGAMGVFIYTGHLANSVFQDSLFFPPALAMLGLGFIWIGIKTQKNMSRLEAWINNHLPPALGKLRPPLRS